MSTPGAAQLIAAIYLLLLSAACPAQTTPTPSLESELLADVGAEISVIALSVNSARRASLRNVDLIGNIINGLPSVEKIYILTNDLAAFTVASNPWPGRIEFIELPASEAITIWTQDPFLVTHQPGEPRPTLLLPRDFERAGDKRMASHLAEAAAYPVRRSTLHFEGGNIVSDQRNAFIGANTIRYNALKLGLNEVEVVRLFEEELGRRVLVVGPVPQPVGHIDMAITPLGENRIAVADARQGLAIARRTLADEPEAIHRFEQYWEDHFFGHPAIKSLRGPSGKSLEAPELGGKTAELFERNRQVIPMLDGIADALGGFGYEVLRVPFFFGGPENRTGEASGDEDLVATYPMLTYNNVLLESSEGRAVAYIPRYGWPQMDEAAQHSWRAHGFEVRTIDGLTVSAMYGGALRCSVKVLERI